MSALLPAFWNNNIELLQHYNWHEQAVMVPNMLGWAARKRMSSQQKIDSQHTLLRTAAAEVLSPVIVVSIAAADKWLEAIKTSLQISIWQVAFPQP